MGSQDMAFRGVLSPYGIYEKHLLRSRDVYVTIAWSTPFPSTDVLIASTILRKPVPQSHSLKYTTEGSCTNLGGLAGPPLYPGHCSALVEDIARLMAEPNLPCTSINMT
jgi:hypothetical protein